MHQNCELGRMYKSLIDTARFYTTRAFREQDYEASREYGAKADESLNAAASLGVSSPEYDFLSTARLVQANGDYESSLILLESAHKKLPSNRQLQMALVDTYVNLKRLKDALYVAQIIQAWSFDRPEIFEKTQELIKDIESQLGAIDNNSNDGQ